MRIRFVHTLSLLLLATVLLAVLTMGGLMAWNLRNGFSDYLASRDVERLEQFAAFVSQQAEQAGSLDALKTKGWDLRELLYQFPRTHGLLPDRRAPPPHAGNASWFSPNPHPPPPHGVESFRERVAIYTHDGKPFLENDLPMRAGPWIERPVQIHGDVVAMVRMLQLKPVPDEVESRFLTSQYLGIASVASALLFLALMGAWWVAGWWVRPLLAVQLATQRIANGEFDFRLNPSRSDEIGDVMRNVNAMAHSLAQLDGTRRQWMADISHELRTPLAVLRGEIEAIVDGVRPLKPEAMLSLREEVLRLSALVDDLHLLAMSDLKALPCYFEELDAIELARMVLQRFELRAAQLGLALRFESPQAVSILVHWDARRIGQLLGNLLDNSLRYTDAPGQVVLKIEPHANHVGMDIKDSAPGVAESDLPRVFEPLYRADAARGRGGSGLGLTICQAIVQAHGGCVTATPSELGGLCIHIELPVQAEDHG